MTSYGSKQINVQIYRGAHLWINDLLDKYIKCGNIFKINLNIPENRIFKKKAKLALHAVKYLMEMFYVLMHSV